jgi:hypothetical protein
MPEGPWWLVAIVIVASLYYGWRAYLHHRYPVDKSFDES